MSAEYVRRIYGVTYKVGDRLIVDGRHGTLVSFPDQYLGVRFDGEKHTSRCHPNWRVSDDCDTPDCGNRRCESCDERMTCLGPEPRACGTTCTDCPCSCQTCLDVREDMRADLLHKIEKES